MSGSRDSIGTVTKMPPASQGFASGLLVATGRSAHTPGPLVWSIQASRSEKRDLLYGAFKRNTMAGSDLHFRFHVPYQEQAGLELSWESATDLSLSIMWKKRHVHQTTLRLIWTKAGAVVWTSRWNTTRTRSLCKSPRDPERFALASWVAVQDCRSGGNQGYVGPDGMTVDRAVKLSNSGNR